MGEQHRSRGSIEHLKKPMHGDLPPKGGLAGDHPAAPPVLDYGSRRDDSRRLGTEGGQLLAGFMFWVISVAGVCAAFGICRSDGVPVPGLMIVGPAIVLVIGVTIWTHVQLRWRSFLPGVLLGVALTCLLPIGTIAVICGFDALRPWGL